MKGVRGVIGVLGLVVLAGGIGGCACSKCRASADAPRHLAEPEDARDEVWDVLDALHAKAAEGAFDAYFDLYAPDAVFLGTDATERWTLTQFMDYSRPHLVPGRGWTYTLIGAKRFITLSADGRTAWFDEALMNAKLGECRGTGVLVLTDRGWKISQYNLTMPVPNAMIERVASEIRSQD